MVIGGLSTGSACLMRRTTGFGTRNRCKVPGRDHSLFDLMRLLHVPMVAD
jgi:hypothetical protein